MFNHLFKPRAVAKAPPVPRRPAAATALARRRRPLATVHRPDPLAAARRAGEELYASVAGAMRGERGVHAESLLTALAALAGHACQASARAEFIERRGWVERQVFVVVDAPDGSTYYLGELAERGLVDGPHSVWSLVAATARRLGVEQWPDVEELGAHVASTYGTPAFGWPRWPDGHQAGRSPIAYLRTLWLPFRRIVDRHCDRPTDWPVAAAFALQQAMTASAASIEPALALRLVIESALPMARARLRLPAAADGAGPAAD